MTEVYIFRAYNSERDFKLLNSYFRKQFTNLEELQMFSKEHRANNYGIYKYYNNDYDLAKITNGKNISDTDIVVWKELLIVRFSVLNDFYKDGDEIRLATIEEKIKYVKYIKSEQKSQTQTTEKISEETDKT